MLSDSNLSLFCFEEVDSTNSVAWRLWEDQHPQDSVLVLAEAQTHGRGTQGRRWSSPKGAGLYCSVLHPVPWFKQPDNFFLETVFTQEAAQACLDVLMPLLPSNTVSIKPINDLYAKGKKLGGILVETRIHPQQGLKAIVTGIGINWTLVKHSLTQAKVAPIALEELMSPVQLASLQKQEIACQLANRLTSRYSVLMDDSLTLL